MEIYQPEEDSYLLSEAVRDYINSLDEKKLLYLKCLDMGTGSGIQSRNLLELGINKENITAVDINLSALEEAEKLGVKIKKSDLFSDLSESFNLIIFNPPYLPEDNYDNLPDTTGGKKGDEIVIRFIKNLKEHMEKEGVCFLLTSSLTPEDNWISEANTSKLKYVKINSKRLFQEELYVWKIQRIDVL